MPHAMPHATPHAMPQAATNALVLTTDFSQADGAVSAMKGVAYQVSPTLTVSDLTHQIEPYNIWQGAYRLVQTYRYWPQGTVFVTVVDPGVGSERKSIVAITNSGHIFVNPDNGLLTLVAQDGGVSRVYQIDEAKQRLRGSEQSYTFHGRDLYVYVGARLASGKLQPHEVGPEFTNKIATLDFQQPELVNGKELNGNIPVLDVNYGNVWTNLPKKLFQETFAGRKVFRVQIFKAGKRVYDGRIPLVETFSGVNKGRPLLYFNSLLNLALALNQDSFAQKHKVKAGPEWSVRIQAL
jgi:S-adenosylmethionine hydrolase